MLKLGQFFVRGAQAADKALVNANALESVDFEEEAAPMTPGQVLLARSLSIVPQQGPLTPLLPHMHVGALQATLTQLSQDKVAPNTMGASTDEEQAEQAHSGCS